MRAKNISIDIKQRVRKVAEEAFDLAVDIDAVQGKEFICFTSADKAIEYIRENKKKIQSGGSGHVWVLWRN